jgi:hypothetical protein
MQRGGERRWGELLGEEECKVEDREWSVAVIAAATNANPQPAGSLVLDKTPGGGLLREYERIIVASASSSSGDNDDDGMLINNDVDGGDDFDGGGGGSNEGEYGGVPRAIDALLGALADIADGDNDNNDNNNGKDGESCDVNGGDGVMSSPSCLDDKLLLLTCLSNDKLNIFDVDDILVKSIASMLVVDDADEGGKDKKDNDDNDADDNDNERSSISTTVDGAKCNVRRYRCLLMDPCKF